MRPLQNCLHGRIAALRGASNLAVYRILSRLLRAVRFALHPVRLVLQRSLLCYVFLISCVHAQTLTIATASSMQPAFAELAQAFHKQTGGLVQAVFGASGKLAIQIQQGAPFDVFLSADSDYPQHLFEAGYANHAPAVYALGTLVLCVSHTLGEPASLGLLAEAKVQRIAIANPALAPFGKQALAALNFYHLEAIAQPKLVYGESILAVNQYLQQGLVDAAMTAKSMVKREGISCTDIPAESHAPIKQSMVLLKNSQPLANKFYGFMLSAVAQTILYKYGYR